MKKILITVASTLLFAASIFYLFVVPVLAALDLQELPIYGIVFGLFMLAQLIMLNIEFGYTVIRRFYDIRGDRESVFFHEITNTVSARALGMPTRKTRKRSKKITPRLLTVFVCFIAYLTTIYVFAVGFMYLSGFDSSAFSSNSQLSVLDAFYFSLVTATTVGYGDIYPVSYIAKALVSAEIVIALSYVVVMFSSISQYLRGNARDDVGLSQFQYHQLRRHLTRKSIRTR